MRRFIPWVATVLVAGACLTVANNAQAGTAQSGCASVGTKTPVLFVPGFMGHPSGFQSMARVVEQQVPNVQTFVFDYSSYNRDWVTNPHIGLALAREVACLATSSERGGGLGQVAIIAHSMGGLAVREAASLKVNGAIVAPDIGMEFTIATPNLGSGWANKIDPLVQAMCNPVTTPLGAAGNVCGNLSALQGLKQLSPQIQQLPFLPTYIPLYALGGDVTLNDAVGFIHLHDDTRSDIIVGDTSALWASAFPAWGGGTDIVSCSSTLLSAYWSPCFHTQLTHNSAVESVVVRTLKRYLAIAPYVPFLLQKGQWFVHGASMQFSLIGNGMTGLLQWNNGPCAPGVGSMCTGHADVTASPTAGGIRLTYTKVWYTVANTAIPFEGYTGQVPGITPGNWFDLARQGGISVHLAKESGPSTLGGNPYWCQNGFDRPQFCGA